VIQSRANAMLDVENSAVLSYSCRTRPAPHRPARGSLLVHAPLLPFVSEATSEAYMTPTPAEVRSAIKVWTTRRTSMSSEMITRKGHRTQKTTSILHSQQSFTPNPEVSSNHPPPPPPSSSAASPSSSPSSPLQTPPFPNPPAPASCPPSPYSDSAPHPTTD